MQSNNFQNIFVNTHLKTEKPLYLNKHSCSINLNK